jgi:hypothetical protein
MYNSVQSYPRITTHLFPLCVRWRLGFDRHRRLMLRQRHRNAREKGRKFRVSHWK